jgi:hypothetical protein
MTQITVSITVRVTLRVTRRSLEYRGCVWRDDRVGRGQNTRMGWNDPTFAHGSVAKVTLGSFQPIAEEQDRVLPVCIQRCNQP